MGLQERVTDVNTAGGAITVSLAPTVIVVGLPIACGSVPVTPHPSCPKPSIHCTAKTVPASGLAARVFAGGLPVVTSDDVDTCGHKRVPGQNTVIIG